MTSRKLEEALESVEWGKPTVFSEHGISHGRATARADNALALAIGVEPPIQITFWARIDPGGFIIPHIDAGVWWERWHFPVETGGHFWQDPDHFSPTEPFQVQHWLPHAVYNDSAGPRVHLIVDRKITPPEAPDYMPLTLTEMIPEVAALRNLVV